MSLNSLNKKKKTKVIDDEFYTRLCDIEEELRHYDFSNKVVYCPCDDYTTSCFCTYFKHNFHKLGLKKLYCSGIKTKKLFAYNGKESKICTLEWGGDFRSDECLNILKQSDIVVTNPPFSLMPEFIKLYTKKDFIIVFPTSSYHHKCYKDIVDSWYKGLVIRKFIRPDDTIKESHCQFISNINTGRNRKVIPINKPIEEYKVLSYEGKDYLWAESILKIPDSYYKPFLVSVIFHMFKDEKYVILNHNVVTKYNGKNLFSQCLVQRIKE